MTPHEILGVATDATPSEIKSAYRKLAMKHHPDRNQGSEESAKRFQEIQDAYDAVRTDKPRTQQQHSHHPNHGHSMHDMHDIFEQFFRRQQMGNPSMQAACDISLEQAFEGCSMRFNVPSGDTVAVDIPAGVEHGQVLRVPEGAGAPNPDYPAGDLNIIVRIMAHETFHRHGMTLMTTFPLDVLDMICGSKQKMKTITGDEVEFEVPENSTPDASIVVKGQGMNRVGGKDRGDLIIHLHPLFKEFSDKQMKALKRVQKLGK